MQIDIKMLLKHDLINISKLADLMEPGKKESARKKYRNKIKEQAGQRMLDKDWSLMEETFAKLK